MNTATQTKDHLLGLLQVENHNEFLENALKVMEAMVLTKGLWAELGYAYKGVDIAVLINDRCVDLLRDCHHAVTIEKINRVLVESNKTHQVFFRLQQEYLHGQFAN